MCLTSLTTIYHECNHITYHAQTESCIVADMYGARTCAPGPPRHRTFEDHRAGGICEWCLEYSDDGTVAVAGSANAPDIDTNANAPQYVASSAAAPTDFRGYRGLIQSQGRLVPGRYNLTGRYHHQQIPYTAQNSGLHHLHQVAYPARIDTPSREATPPALHHPGDADHVPIYIEGPETSELLGLGDLEAGPTRDSRRRNSDSLLASIAEAEVEGQRRLRRRRRRPPCTPSSSPPPPSPRRRGRPLTTLPPYGSLRGGLIAPRPSPSADDEERDAADADFAMAVRRSVAERAARRAHEEAVQLRAVAAASLRRLADAEHAELVRAMRESGDTAAVERAARGEEVRREAVPGRWRDEGGAEEARTPTRSEDFTPPPPLAAPPLAPRPRPSQTSNQPHSDPPPQTAEDYESGAAHSAARSFDGLEQPYGHGNASTAMDPAAEVGRTRDAAQQSLDPAEYLRRVRLARSGGRNVRNEERD
ncbi:hypothetical protein NpPPO83_00002786 [Neofusicoccum parvum]|uniref:Uncharacterized protein n=1 Tax=Neofusicoccum parvum TaxID=310453 RepID=A0ACB5SIL4_9PEZI|nr:hypothetical protein NpPPO83_00002786 [Neofusicoccum parvum]